MSVTEAWLKLDQPFLYEKEILPIGKLTRWVSDAKEVLEANITRPFLDNIVSNFKKFKEVGVRVPVFKTHSEDPSNKRGQVEDVYVKKNSRGEDSLYGKIKFDNQEAVSLGTVNDVSALIPPKFVDGRGNKYMWPLRHVAITSTPVLPGLEDWNGPVVLAFEDASIGEDNVDLKPLMEELSLDYSDDASPEEQLKSALTTVRQLKSALSLSMEKEDEIALSFPPVMMKHLKASRETVVKSLMLGPDPIFSPKMGQQIIDKYCSEEALRLDLSQDKEETEFDRTIELAQALAKDRPLPNKGRKVIKLSRTEETNPLLQDAQRRVDLRDKAAKAS